MLDRVGAPSEDRMYIFNGDYVDRGSWAVELLIMLLCWKVALPTRVYLLRGNHETGFCTQLYGFKKEVLHKYQSSLDIHKEFKKLFAALPLAALINKTTLVLHGGLFRANMHVNRSKGKKRRRTFPPASAALKVGGLDDLRASGKGGLNPYGTAATMVATDILWSDPKKEEGLEENVSRGIGLLFGPDITKAFLEDNGLRLVLRSHEGPDARDGREDFGSMAEGWTLDHDTSAGKLMTVFSAPDYPMFQCGEAEDRYNNRASVALLTPPSWCEPRFITYGAVRPRPQAPAFYDYEDVPGSDEELPLQSDMSGLSDLAKGEDAFLLDDADASTEVDSQTTQPTQPQALAPGPHPAA